MIKIFNLQKTRPCGSAIAGKLAYCFAILLSMVLFRPQWTAFAAQLPEPSLPVSIQITAIKSRLPGETPVIADVDGDKEQDVVSARLVEGRYKIFVALSSRPDLITLNPPVQSAGFRIHVFDINRDNYQDIIITAPSALHPLAVWLGDGKGSFRPANQTAFENELELTEPFWHEDRSLPVDQDLLIDPPHPVGEKMSLAFAIPALDPNGYTLESANLSASANESRCLTLRSPPLDSHD